MKAFLKVVDDKAWMAVEKGWTALTALDNDGKVTDLPQDKWTEDHHEEVIGNSKAMNAIFSAVEENIFKLISNYEVAKDAWDILLVAHEGTNKVRSQSL